MSGDGPVRQLVVMGVSGSGKSTVGSLLAQAIGARFVDADDLHSAEARASMSAGVPLTDEDREPWLARVAAVLAGEAAARRRVVVACSALRRRYRDALRDRSGAPILFVHLAGEAAVVEDRMRRRAGHFMPAALLESQLATLEPLQDDETGLVIDLRLPPERLVERIRAEIEDEGESVSP